MVTKKLFFRFFSVSILALLGVLTGWIFNVFLPGQSALSSNGSKRASEDECLVDKDVLVEVRREKKKLKDREKNLKEKSNELKARETALQEEIIRLKELRDQISLIEGQNDAKLEERTSKLMETFQKMSPKKVAKILSKADDHLAISAMSRIPAERLAKIVNNMEPERSSHLAQLMTSNDWKKSSRKPASNGAKNARKGG